MCCLSFSQHLAPSVFPESSACRLQTKIHAENGHMLPTRAQHGEHLGWSWLTRLGDREGLYLVPAAGGSGPSFCLDDSAIQTRIGLESSHCPWWILVKVELDPHEGRRCPWPDEQTLFAVWCFLILESQGPQDPGH